jgi:hypothetical protein
MLLTENSFTLEKNKVANPGVLCQLGLERMAGDFKRFHEQYELNVTA